jgi:hypothetical protein
MNSPAEEEIQQIKYQLIRLQIYYLPGPILAGLGLFGLLEAKGESSIEFLNSQTNCYVILAIGAAIIAWECSKIIALSKKQSELKKQQKN